MEISEVRLLNREHLCKNFDKCKFEYALKSGKKEIANIIVRLDPLKFVPMQQADIAAFERSVWEFHTWGTDGDIRIIRQMRNLLGYKY